MYCPLWSLSRGKELSLGRLSEEVKLELTDCGHVDEGACRDDAGDTGRSVPCSSLSSLANERLKLIMVYCLWWY